jgi:hypothetical protein
MEVWPIRSWTVLRWAPWVMARATAVWRKSFQLRSGRPIAILAFAQVCEMKLEAASSSIDVDRAEQDGRR